MRKAICSALAVLWCGLTLAAEEHPVLGQVAMWPLPIRAQCHTQGMALWGDSLFLSCVQKKEKRACLYRVSLAGIRAHAAEETFKPEVRHVDLTDGERYHPSGLDVSGKCLWVAVAEYHPAPATSVILCLDPQSLVRKYSFEVQDHIGALAAFEGRLIGANWDARKFYIWDHSGKQMDVDKSRLGFAAQDCKALSRGELICGGTSGLWPKGVLAIIQADPAGVARWQVKKTLIINERSRRGRPLTNEALEYQDGLLYLVPDDFPEAAVYVYRGAPLLDDEEEY